MGAAAVSREHLAHDFRWRGGTDFAGLEFLAGFVNGFDQGFPAALGQAALNEFQQGFLLVIGQGFNRIHHLAVSFHASESS